MFNDQDEGQPIEVQKETYLSRLSARDRQNLETVEDSFRAFLGVKGMKGALVAVGGSINKPLPRKDIDLAILIADHPEPDGKRLTPYKRALRGHQQVLDFVSSVQKEHPDFKIVDEIPPLIDEEFESESILRHDGSVKVQFAEGTPLEFMRQDFNNGVGNIGQRGKPHVVLATI